MDKSFGNAVHLCGLTVSDIGDSLNVSDKTVNNWMSGRRAAPDFAWSLVVARWNLILSYAQRLPNPSSQWMMTEKMIERANGLYAIEGRTDEIDA